MQSSQLVPFTIESVLAGMRSWPDSPDLYRIRLRPAHVPGGRLTIKYLAAPNTSKIFTGSDAHRRRHDNLSFNRIPAGDWVVGRLVAKEERNDGEGGKLELTSTETDAAALRGRRLASAEPVWCGGIVDESDCHDLSDRWTTIINAAGQQFSIIQSRDPGLAPRFLAHVTENHSQVIEFLLKHIPDAHKASLPNLEKCKAALAQLHALGIVKSQLQRHSFLVRDDCSVLIQGPFDAHLVDVGDNDEIMKMEMESLEAVLARSPSVYQDQSARILRMVDPQRSKLFEDFEKADGFVVPFAY
ncbi:uncharacterized protein BCR38DRAFT_491170 [Pseudomassariella vexata]|uniref:Uncharacterized protein n=1 Tax=Pseudomassariella vexata TaxID=1141098 RepID=A0A1Y2D7L4_9PEZI|nr:uncharacterized protein BCR38DRAFT_491170 [Pseudomassariella vexata]ORY55261.1 hypothetical protein BCR38DRAFT_491170 [Pseudomassariella vexata]